MTMTASRALPYLLLATGFVVFSTVFAQQVPTEAQEVDWLQLGMGLFGGLALFLGGLDVLSEGLKKAAGNTLRMVLQKLTVNRFMGATTGAFVTAVLNFLVGHHRARGRLRDGWRDDTCTVGRRDHGGKHRQYHDRAAPRLQSHGLFPDPRRGRVFHDLRQQERSDKVFRHDDHGSGAGVLRHGVDEPRHEAPAQLRTVSGHPRQHGKPAVRDPGGGSRVHRSRAVFRGDGRDRYRDGE